MWAQVKLALVVAAILAICETGAMGQNLFDENFDNYATGSDLHGQGGWKGWDNDAQWGAPTSNLFSVSPDNSAAIGGNADLVHEFDVTGGLYRFSAMQYIPNGTVGENFFILLNTYNDGGPYDWSVQVNLNLGTGQMTSDFGAGATLPIKYDEWVELRFDIDLDTNTVDEYYDGDLLSTHVWDDTGNNTIGAIDLFGNGASAIYYDDLSLIVIPEPTSFVIMFLGLGLGALVVRFRRRR